MSIVSNSSLLINLARIGRLDILHHLYSELTVPGAVWREGPLKPYPPPGSSEIVTSR